MTHPFTHLHVHSEYSLLDGLSKVKKLIEHVKNSGMDSVAITDHGSMYAAIEFYKAAKTMEIKPIIGMEGYLTNQTLGEEAEKVKTPNYHILYLAKNEEGYKNLMEISSIAHLKGFYYRPRIDKETLKKYSKGIICTSACPAGEVGQFLIEGDYKKAKKAVEWYLDVFKDDYYLEIQRHNYLQFINSETQSDIKQEITKMAKDEEIWNEGVIKLSREMGIPLIATNDAHYIKKEDAPVQDALVCIATGKTVNETKRLRFIDTPSFYIKTPEEMNEDFKDLPEAINNTQVIKDKINLEIILGKWFFPEFDLPKGMNADKQLEKLAHSRLPQRIEKPSDVVKERLKYELSVIIQKGYAPYFLIVMDIVNWANDQGIITNTRGSAAGCLVSFVLGITTVDPIEYYLPFERFLNPYRPSPPDIDLDVADNKRDRVIDYICQKYGKDKVAQICTFGRMLSRGSVRDIARVLGYPYAIGDRISKLIPPPKQGFPITIPRALNEVSELKSLYDTDSDSKKILDFAQKIEGNARHISVHAAGVVVSPTKLTEFSPVQKEPSGEKIITQYEMHACEDVGLIKFDILGIRNLSILGSAVEIVKKLHDLDIDLHEIPLDDKKTFEMLGRGETMGTFQLSSTGMTKYLKELKPERIEDLMAMVALYRPGPIAVIPEYIKRKRNPSLVKYLDPRMEKFLKASYGLIVYQDDLLFCALELAGYSWEEADKFRKAVGKKIPEEMAAQKEKLIDGIVKNGQTKEFAENLWLLFEPFQSYGFNKAHAASYGMIAYQTAYMKANFPVEFMTALLTAESGDTEKISQAISECKKMGIKVLPPDINESQDDFTIVDEKNSLDKKAIRFGLNAVKNVGKAAMEAIFEAREDGNFTNIVDFLLRTDARKVNKKVLESLIKVGAFSNFGKRSLLLSRIDELKQKYTKRAHDSQQGLFQEGEENKKSFDNNDTFLNDNTPEFTDEEVERLEKELLGFSLSAKPVSEILDPFEFEATHKINELSDETLSIETTIIVAIVKEVRVIITKKSGEPMAFVRVEDTTGIIDTVVFPRTYTEIKDILIENSPLIITGKIDKRDEGLNLIVQSIIPAKAHESGEYFIRVPKTSNLEILENLKTLLLENPGDCTTLLVFEGSGKKIKLPMGVAWSPELSAKINELLHNNLSS